MLTIALSAGHYPEKPGACATDPVARRVVATEHELALAWRETLVECLKAASSAPLEMRLIRPGILSAKIREVNELPTCALAIEIHFNAAADRHGTPTGEGSETLYCPGSIKGEELAESVQREMAQVFSPSRGVKPGWYRMDVPNKVDFPGDVEGDEVVDAFLVRTLCPSIIVEPEFIHRHALIREKQLHGCQAIARGIIRYLETRSPQK